MTRHPRELFPLSSFGAKQTGGFLENGTPAWGGCLAAVVLLVQKAEGAEEERV